MNKLSFTYGDESNTSAFACFNDGINNEEAAYILYSWIDALNGSDADVWPDTEAA